MGFWITFDNLFKHLRNGHPDHFRASFHEEHVFSVSGVLGKLLDTENCHTAVARTAKTDLQEYTHTKTRSVCCVETLDWTVFFHQNTCTFCVLDHKPVEVSQERLNARTNYNLWRWRWVRATKSLPKAETPSFFDPGSFAFPWWQSGLVPVVVALTHWCSCFYASSNAL